jgi:hypothetical protein
MKAMGYRDLDRRFAEAGRTMERSRYAPTPESAKIPRLPMLGACVGSSPNGIDRWTV